VSRSNHSNKSEEVSSTIHKQINVINMFQNDNADFYDSNYGMNNSMRESQLNINNKAGHISIKELIAHRNA